MTSKATSKSKQATVKSFEDSLNELETLVEKMENGNLSLEDSLKSFERGIGLFRYCQQSLKQAELKVQTLLDPENPEQIEDFNDDD